MKQRFIKLTTDFSSVILLMSLLIHLVTGRDVQMWDRFLER